MEVKMTTATQITQVPILLVEDDEFDVNSIRGAFSENQLTNPIAVAKDGIDALEKLRGTNGQTRLNPFPRVIMLDINMPRMNGIEFLRELRADPLFHNLLVFMFASTDYEKDIISSYNLNISGYIKKPLNFDNLTKTIFELNSFWSQLQFPPEQ